MSGNSTGSDNGDDGGLRDPALRRALDHAPDRDALPDPRTRDAILKMAHNLAAAPVPAAAHHASVLPWWRRVFFGDGGGAPRSRMPWNAAFATVLVAAFVTVLWRSEPVPEARLDGEARVGGAAAPVAEAPVAPSTPAAPAAPSVSPPASVAGVAPGPVPPAQTAKPAPAATAAEQRAKASRDAASAREIARAQPSRKEAAAVPAPPPAPPPSASVPAPAPAAVAPAAPAIVAEQAAPAPGQDERREERAEGERRRALAAAPAGALQDTSPRAAKAAPPPPAAPAPQAVQPMQRAVSPFSALERWTSFSAGAGARRARGEVEGLAALVGTVARSAHTPDASLDAPVDARLSLYRGETLVAVLEIAGDQVRWTPQPGGAAWVGTPPASALAALRSLLAR